VKHYIAALVLAFVLAGCCTHQVEQGAMGRLEAEVGDMGVRYLKYVDADPVFGGAALTPEQRKKAQENERSWVGRVKGIATALKGSLED